MMDHHSSKLDDPDILNLLFHPRVERGVYASGKRSLDVQIPVEESVSVGARFHLFSTDAPSILFFHGNGEIVADYDELASFYHQREINFLPVDYRGYGLSGGNPTVTSMMRDSHLIYKFVTDWLKTENYTGALIIMGRSLGSASALELAGRYGDQIDGIIIESGFAYTVPLLRLLGIDVERLGIAESDGFGNLDKLTTFHKPLLVIHAEHDHIIPFSDGLALFETSMSRDKSMLKIPGANHNDIFAVGLSAYMDAVTRFANAL